MHQKTPFFNKQTSHLAKWALVLFLLTLAIGSFLISFTDPYLGYCLNTPKSNLCKIPEGMSQIQRGFGIFFLGSSLLELFLRLAGESIIEVLSSFVKWFVGKLVALKLRISQTSLKLSVEVAGIILVMIAAVATRAAFLNGPMWLDETITVNRYVNQSWFNLFNYTEPNNHVLHTILVKISAILFGLHPTAIRLPAFLAGLGAVIAIYFVARKMISPSAGLFALITIAFWPYAIFFSVNSRGYSLMMLFTILLLFIGWKVIESPTRNRVILFSVVCSVGLFTIPSMLYAILGLVGWIFLSLSINSKNVFLPFRKFVLPAGFLTALQTILLYLPVILRSNGVEAITKNRYVVRDSVFIGYQKIFAHLAFTFKQYNQEIPNPIVYGFVFLFFLGCFEFLRQKKYTYLLLFPAMLLATISVTFLNQKIPFPRTWFYYLPIVSFYTSAGFSAISNWFKKGNVFFSSVVILLALLFSIQIINHRSVEYFAETGQFTQGEVVAKVLLPAMQPGDRIYYKKVTHRLALYYLQLDPNFTQKKWKTVGRWFWPGSVENSSFQILGENGNSIPGYGYYIVEEPYYSIDVLTKQPVSLFFNYEGVSIYKSLEKIP